MTREEAEFHEKRKAEKWIPCSERLPVKIGNYLVTTSRGGVWAKRWDRGWCGNKNNNNIKAWMPLPSPYKGDKS